jgi:tetratricopeptide (TPR) repeat protein
VAGNARIDDLRKRIERDPQSRLFAQLAEELRKDGDLAEAIQVARDGLSRHPQYPSARLTLGRALMDTGDTRSAVRELEAAVKGAPDNLLASRLLGECLETEGQLDAALERYRATLPLAAGDRTLAAKIEALEARMKKAPAAAVATPAEPPRPVPLQVLDADGPMELEAAYERPSSFVVRRLDEDEDLFDAAAVEEPPPIPLVETSEEFELERPYDALAARAPVPMPVPLPEDLDPAGASVPPLEPELLTAEPEADLNSSTLAELYFNQGFTDQAIDVYRRIAEREPDNERVQARLRELEALQRHLHAEEKPAAPSPAPAPPSGDARAARRAALERTIARLEGLQAAFRKG